MTATELESDTHVQTITALIADDHDFTRSWLSERLAELRPDVKSVCEAATAEEAVRKAASYKPSLVLMDISFNENKRVPQAGKPDEPVLDGLDAAGKIWKELPDARIIIVSAYVNESFVRRLFEVIPPSGRYGYIVKERLASTLEAAVDAVLSEDCWIDPAVMTIHNRQVNRGFELPDNLYEVLMGIALGLSDQTISELLYIVEQSVQYRLRKLYSHFGIPSKTDPKSGLYNSRCRAVKIATEHGLITESDLQQWASLFQQRADDKKLGITI